MSDLVSHLRSFNRKERFILLSEALGRDILGGAFRGRLGEAIGVAVPDTAFVAMDYHLDWLQMALYLAGTPNPPDSIPKSDVIGSSPQDFNQNQMDVDLLVAFDEGSTTRLVLIEAKMETGWTNDQMSKKAERLRAMFDDPSARGLAEPCFLLLSPRRPQQLNAETWPSWMTRDGEPIWMELRRPAGLRKVTRCGPDGRASATGDFLRIDP
ncbi:MAG: hypothetical protein F4X26_05020 [Chloroflexi bacterium]|nr:hypothetical protein [Chloroflexota bacterium]